MERKRAKPLPLLHTLRQQTGPLRSLRGFHTRVIQIKVKLFADMLRYKKHKRQADGLATSGTQMDDTDREVSSFTDRAFRSLCVAEEELFNDVPHLPSPIRGMPLSTKYHLGIFNLSVRKTQPLAQLPTTPRQRGKWAPTFQPLLNYTKVGLTDVKTNNTKLCAPVPRGYKQRSKVSSLIKTFDNIENEIPDDSPLHARLLAQKGSQRDTEESPVSEIVERIDGSESLLESNQQDDSHVNESQLLYRRTAREVFLESQTDINPRLSRSPAMSPGSPLGDQVKKVVKQRDSLRRTAFLHSEHSAFKTWSDINRRTGGGDESDSSIPGTPPIPRSATPCSPLLQRALPGMKTRDGGQELGWASPASSLASSYDANQMLRTVPPLPIRKNTKQNRDTSHKTARTPLNARNQDGMKIYEGQSSTKEQVNWMNKENNGKSPEQFNPGNTLDKETDVNNASQTFIKQKDEDQGNITSTQQLETSEATSNKEVKESEKDMPPPGRIKTLIQQIEKEVTKELAPVQILEKKGSNRDASKDEPIVPTVLEKSSLNSNTNSNDIIPPWRKTKSSNTSAPEKKNPSTNVIRREAVQSQENIPVCKEDIIEEKPSFSISNLLTPVIRRKNIHEALEDDFEISPPVSISAKDQDERESSLYQKRNDYKSKATRLLFNLKDMRKRVKSMYNPATTSRNGYENILLPDVKLPEDTTSNNHLAEVKKLPSETESTNQTHFAENVQRSKESEIESDFAGNGSENYLSLSPMDQSTALQNGDILIEKVLNCTHEENAPSLRLSPNENQIRREMNYPSLNLCSKEDPYMQDSLTCLKNPEVHPLPIIENAKEETRPDAGEDVVSSQPLDVLETSVENVLTQTAQGFSSHEIESQLDVENDESEKQVVENDETKDVLQYFAVNSNDLDSNEKFQVLESQIEKEKGEEKLKVEEPRAESECAEEIRRPPSITPFKPNLFHLKDNKIKSSPVTKSVRPRLYRSLSEDCLVFSKLEESNFPWRAGDLRNTRECNGISTDILNTRNIEVTKVNNNPKHKMISPASEPPKLEAIGCNQIKNTQEKVKNQTWKDLYDDSARKRAETKESDTIRMTKDNQSKNSPSLEESFFHPVETCVSEVTGPSPECNTLIAHNVNESLNELVNGEHISSPLINHESINYSPIDNGLLQFEDSVGFAEDIACSTITSPVSESVTCSIVASPTSINTQSSGFTTALSAFDDVPSPPSTSLNITNGKFNFPLPERVNPTDSEPKSIDLPKPERASLSESQKMYAKPPAVPPKTEKALRRAKRLTKKRRKTEIPQRIQEGDFKESDIVPDVPTPGNVTPTPVIPQSHHKLISCPSRTLDDEDLISEVSTPSLPPTQRKLLQDPDSGQYFMVDIPVCLRIKTFYDPETGKYLQMSLPSSERQSPAFEMSNSPCMMYQGLTPVPVSSIVSLKGASQALNHDNVNTCESSWNDRGEEPLKMHHFLPCDANGHRMTDTPMSMDRFTSRSSDIISMKDIDDFAMEAVS
ncbi:cardiac-enriched FHL2-interacting protein isoform X2 [Engystomops pustulosus]|uniref:cardiac-enriched FHL2-interacting protein isoform X2 n=1 Tax=Engystomops pustulosus TaxID=76066 RepID=UPI003AFB28D0